MENAIRETAGRRLMQIKNHEEHGIIPKTVTKKVAEILEISTHKEEGKEKKAREYKHMTFYEAAHLAKEADVKQMWLTHYSPSLVRAEEFMGKVKSIFPRAKAGKDGKTITLDFQEE